MVTPTVSVRSLKDVPLIGVAFNTPILLLSDTDFKKKMEIVHFNVDIILFIVVRATAVNSSEAP